MATVLGWPSIMLTPATLTGGKFIWSNGEEVTASGVFVDGTTFINNPYTGYGPIVLMDNTYQLWKSTQMQFYSYPVLCKKI
jgi:hypothetical protein